MPSCSGPAIGVPLGLLVPMTAVPQRTALSHAFGALAAALVGTAEYYAAASPTVDRFTMAALGARVLLGFLTFTGSLMAFGKLQELIRDRADGRTRAELVNISALLACGRALVVAPRARPLVARRSSCR